MERGNILLLTVIVAALGFFALRFFPDSATISPGVATRGHATRSRDVAERGGRDMRSREFASAEGRRPGGVLSRSRGGQPRLGGSEDEGGRAPSSATRGEAPTARGTNSTRGGSIGTAAGPRRTGDVPGGVSILDSPRSGAPRLNGDLAGSRGDLVETLAAQPATKKTLLDGGPGEVEDGDDVVLAVSSTEDTEQASQKAEVNEPRYGESGVELTPGSVLAFPDAGNVNGDAGTITLEFTNNWAGADEGNNGLVQIREVNQWTNRFELVRNGKYLRFIITGDDGIERDISYNIESWTTGEHHQVTPTWGNGEMRLYVDGRLVGRNTYDGTLRIRPGTPMHLGSEFANYKGFDGIIHKAVVYGRAKSEEEIAGGF